MKTLDDFIKLMNKVFDFLPRYLELCEKSTRTEDEEIELDEIITKIESFKNDIIKMIPELNPDLYNNFIESYFNIKYKNENIDKESISKYNDMKTISHAPLKEWLKNSMN